MVLKVFSNDQNEEEGKNQVKITSTKVPTTTIEKPLNSWYIIFENWRSLAQPLR